eukprot:759038-Rhodomonas_salina.2
MSLISACRGYVLVRGPRHADHVQNQMQDPTMSEPVNPLDKGNGFSYSRSQYVCSQIKMLSLSQPCRILALPTQAVTVILAMVLTDGDRERKHTPLARRAHTSSRHAPHVRASQRTVRLEDHPPSPRLAQAKAGRRPALGPT